MMYWYDDYYFLFDIDVDSVDVNNIFCCCVADFFFGSCTVFADLLLLLLLAYHDGDSNRFIVVIVLAATAVVVVVAVVFVVTTEANAAASTAAAAAAAESNVLVDKYIEWTCGERSLINAGVLYVVDALSNIDTDYKNMKNWLFEVFSQLLMRMETLVSSVVRKLRYRTLRLPYLYCRNSTILRTCYQIRFFRSSRKRISRSSI